MTIIGLRSLELISLVILCRSLREPKTFICSLAEWPSGQHVRLKYVVAVLKSYVKKLTSGRRIRYLTGLIDVSSLIRSLSAVFLIVPNKVFRVAL